MVLVWVGEGGFEPPKSLTTDLQSAPFGHSGIPPYLFSCIPLFIQTEAQRSGFGLKRKKAGADVQLSASAGSETERASFDVELVDGLEPPTC